MQSTKKQSARNEVVRDAVELLSLWRAPAKRSGDGALIETDRGDPKRCRAALATALHKVVISLCLCLLLLSSVCAFASAKKPTLSERAANLIKRGTREQKVNRNMRAALPLFVEGYRLARQDGNPEFITKCAWRVVSAHLDVGENEQALRVAEEFLSLARMNGDRRQEAWALDYIGNVLFYRTEYTQALQKFQESAALMRAGGDLLGAAAALKDVGITQRYLGHDQALETLHEALELYRQTNDQPGIRSSLLNIATSYEHFDYRRQALQAYQQVLTLARADNDATDTYHALTYLGLLYLQLDGHAQALAMFREALAISEEAGANPTQRAWILIGLSWANFELGNVDQAIQIEEQALVLARQAGNIEEEAACYRDLGRYHIERDTALAVNYYQRAISFMQQHDLPLSSRAYEGLAMAYLRQEDFDKAIEFYEKSIAEIESMRSHISSEHRRASFFGKHQTIYQGLVEALLKRSERSAEKRPDQARAFAVLEKARARSVLDALSSVRHELDKEIAPELSARQKTLSVHIAELQRSLLRAGPSPNEQRRLLERLSQAEDEFELLLSKIKSGNPRYVAGLYPQPLSLAHAQSALDDETALLAYSILRGGVAVFVLTRTDFHVEKLSVAADALSSRVQNYVDLLAVSDDEGWKAISHRLENDLLSSARGHLGAEIRRLVIVPDGTLHYLPFETLRAARNSRFLIEDFEVSYVPSATIFAQLKASQPAGERHASALVFADPSLPARPLSAVNPSQPKGEIARSLFEHEDWQVQSLPASAREAEAIARFAGQSSRVYTGTAASEKRFKSEPLEGYRILHFATHGLISQEIPARSSLLLSIEGGADVEDGLLQAREIYQLKLFSDLVVLSGCQTARGQILKGEGIEGLAQAFFYAGARSVVASLWRVTDEATAEFMLTFYKNLGEGKSKAASLRTAKLQLLQADETLAPRHWAAFVLLGEANDSIATPRGEGQSQGWKWALLGIGGLCVVLTAFLIFRR